MNIRRKILILNFIILIPILFFLIYLNINRLQESRKSKIQNLHNVAEIVAAENTQVVENAKHLLATISVIPEVQNPNNKCDSILSDILTKYRRYGNFGITDLSGNVICSAVSTNQIINLSDRFFFKETIKNNGFSTGEYVISKSTGKASINFGYPRKNNNGLIYATLNLDWLNELTANLDIDKNLIVMILDKKGIVMARYPDSDSWVGKEFPNNPILNTLNNGEEIIETSGIDGIERIYSFESSNKDLGPYVLVGQTKEAIYKDSSNKFIEQSIISIIILFFSVVSGLMVGKSLIENTVQKLKEVDSLRKDFISLISHQIRTPATSIKWFIEILLSGSLGRLNRKQRDILRDTYTSTNRMVELISNILNITKFENDKINLQIKRIDIRMMINDINKSINREFKNKLIKIKLNITKSVPQTIGIDEKLFYQALFNIIHNSFKYSHKKGIVKISIEKINKNIVIKISDNGIGIPKNEDKNLFTKFSRATNANYSDTAGAGLGLYLSKLIINAHNGKIIIGKQKSGTLVLITIPLL